MPLSIPIEQHCTFVVQNLTREKLEDAVEYLIILDTPPCFFANFCDLELRTTERMKNDEIFMSYFS